MVKDKMRPKGPMSAYACFVQVIREEHKKKHPEESVVFAEFSKKCAEKWKTMNPKEKKRFEDMASRDKERYNREMDDYVPADGSKGKKRKKPKDPNMPKRALTAFFLFSDEHRQKIRDEHPDWRVSEVAKELGRMWEACTDRPKYEAAAVRDKQRYEDEMNQYRQGTFVPTKRPRPDDSAAANHDAADDDDDGDDE
ncbi:hypothetical protein BOX15_Mlig030660g2 [Macrostomum lignano]|uniref:High mobility group protein n=2 Tax=Macrostomum lignano TaxID=282301 RepID=A0A1I8IJA4_9PLAT|nr:hypothetical protein BOX15_Mlig030660g2 [Macrostomum lignano]